MTIDSHAVLDEELELVKANVREFAVHYTTYRENIFFRQSWERRVSIFGEDAPCYWITFQQKRIGGVCIEPNLLSSLFLEPPFVDLYRLLSRLKRLLIQCSEPGKPIRAYGILLYQTEHFLRLGFCPSESRRVMIRPTECYEPLEWGEEFQVISPAPDHAEQMAELFFESYSGSDSIGYPGENTIEQQKSGLEYYFSNNKAEILRKASAIVYDKSSNEMVAACLISLWEDLPLVSNIAVIPQYRGKRIATKLL